MLVRLQPSVPIIMTYDEYLSEPKNLTERIAKCIHDAQENMPAGQMYCLYSKGACMLIATKITSQVLKGAPGINAEQCTEKLSSD